MNIFAHAGRYIAVLFAFLALSFLGDRLGGDERQQFTLWLVMAACVVGILSFRFRPASRAGADSRKWPATNELPAVYKVVSAPTRRWIWIGVLAFLILTWTALIQFGFYDRTEREQLLSLVPIFSGCIPALLILYLAVLAPAFDQESLSFFRSIVFTLAIGAGSGIVFVPLVAMGVWDGWIDFPRYSEHVGLVWMGPTLLAIFIFVKRTNKR